MNAHRHNNHLASMTLGEQMWETKKEIKDGIVDYYQGFYSKREDWRPLLGGVDFNSLDAATATQIESPFSEEEVVTTLKQLSGEKPPGPDSFTLVFFHHCWDVVKAEVLTSIQEFYEQASIKWSLNATFVVLIPKKVGASDVKTFTPST